MGFLARSTRIQNQVEKQYLSILVVFLLSGSLLV